MRVSTLLSVAALALAVSARAAAPMEFPYEAVVESDDVIVRSGPGERYDPTLKLKTGDRVTVHRHDPGGWFTISPPPGSFSWIDAAFVERRDSGTGVVSVPHTGEGLPPRVVVWIGSPFTDKHNYYGRQLATGDEVRILGEKTIPSERGPANFLKIAPPPHEYRWVKGDFIVPLSDAGRLARPGSITTSTVSASPQQLDPFASPSVGDRGLPAPGFPPGASPPLQERELKRGIESQTARSSAEDSAKVTAERSQLYDLDEQLRAMIAQTPDRWDLGGMEQAYRQLQGVCLPSVAAQIDTRLAAIEARQKIKAEFDAFVSVTTQTQQRDAALLSMQQSIAGGHPISTLPVELGPSTPFPPQLTEGAPQSIPAVPLPGPTPATTPQAPDAALPQMDGAGIVQRLPRPRVGAPQHALIAPDGRLLAYLQAGQGVRLDSYVGKQMGVIGQRTHDARLQADVIVVERLMPVQLQPQ